MQLAKRALTASLGCDRGRGDWRRWREFVEHRGECQKFPNVRTEWDKYCLSDGTPTKPNS